MENLFNILWAVLGVSGLIAGLWLRRRIGLGEKRELARDLLLLGVIVFLLLPVISMSDDIGYFHYYFSRGHAPDCAFWVSGARREKQLPSLVVLQVIALLLAAIVSAFRRGTVLGAIALAEPARVLDRSAAATYLRAPPFSRF